MIARKPIAFTKAGLEEKQQEMKSLEHQRVKAVIDLADAREQGDRSENAAYKSARWRLSGIDRQLRILRRILREATVVERTDTGMVEIGAIIKLSLNGTVNTFTIVGQEESNLAEYKLSHVSPIGRSLMGKRAGFRTNVRTPGGLVPVELLEVQ